MLQYFIEFRHIPLELYEDSQRNQVFRTSFFKTHSNKSKRTCQKLENNNSRIYLIPE